MKPPLAELLDLEPHPEGGWYRRTWKSPERVVTRDGRDRPTATMILFFLPAGESSAWHRVASDEIWLAQQGVVTLELGGDGPTPVPVETKTLGVDLAAGEQLQAVVPAGVWQRTAPSDADALVSCVVSPGFDFADFELLVDLSGAQAARAAYALDVPGADATPADVDELIELMREAASAYIGGNIRRYFELMKHADDFTLMDPFGGETSRTSGASEESIAALEAFFRGGTATLEVVESYSSGDLAVLVAVEHQHGLVGDKPAQDWSLRATLVFRLEDGAWRLVHRHADPLVHPITFDQLSLLARGEPEVSG